MTEGSSKWLTQTFKLPGKLMSRNIVPSSGIVRVEVACLWWWRLLFLLGCLLALLHKITNSCLEEDVQLVRHEEHHFAAQRQTASTRSVLRVAPRAFASPTGASRTLSQPVPLS